MTQKLQALLTVGVSASGKSTFADEWIKKGNLVFADGQPAGRDRVEINRDAVRKQLVEADGKEFTWKNWKWKRESEVTAIIKDAIRTAKKNGCNIIVSDTNLNPKTRKDMTTLLNSHGYEVSIKEFPITLEEAWARDAARKNGVGHSVIAKQYDEWLKYIGRKTYVADVTKPSCILVDIDGTLAHMNGKRGAFEWNKVGIDDVDEHVKSIVNMIPETTMVIVLSGRDGVCQPETEKWLEDNVIRYDRLIMRIPNDMRKDTVVKEEIFWRDIANNYNVQFVIDDRPSVCRMWREIGLKVFQVGNPHVEF